MIHVQIDNYSNKVGYDLFPKTKITVEKFEYSFCEGKCYCLSNDDFSGYLVSLIVSGQIKNNKITISDEIKKIKDIESFSILMGLDCDFCATKENKIKILQNIPLMEKYGLTESRLMRKMKYMSSERWRVSFALGELMHKKIYCFPWISSELVDMYSSIWLSNYIKDIKSKGGIILIPTNVTEKNKFLFDEIIC